MLRAIRINEKTIMENLETGGWDSRIYFAEKQNILGNDNMDMEEVRRNMDVAALNSCDLTIRDIIFKDGTPIICKTMHFDFIERDKMVESAVTALANFSLTHRLMFATYTGKIYITESEDHQTNIDAELLDYILNLKWRG